MLHYETIYPDTLGLLRQLMKMPALRGFCLAGGTSLALQIGHRISYDLDMFGSRPFEADEILDLLAPIVKVTILQQAKNILILDAQGIKLDFVNYRYPLLNAPLLVENIRLVSKPDIAAMKLAAIAGRGKKRDFTDLYFLLQEFGLQELIYFYNQKYTDGSEMMIARSLSYFEDADNEEDTNLLRNVSWETIKGEISKQVRILYT